MPLQVTQHFRMKQFNLREPEPITMTGSRFSPNKVDRANGLMMQCAKRLAGTNR